jgi:hypothetical protein
MTTYSLLELEKQFITQGINDLIGKEFSINKKSLSIEDVKIIIDYILNYIESEKKQIKNLETFGCGSWMIQFVFNGIYIELHELKDVIDGNNQYKFDLSKTITFFKQQANLCIEHKVKPFIPKIGQKIAVSKEIYDGSEANGVRYNAPEHMTGWYLTSNSYNGDIKSLMVDHLYHLLQERPDLAKFLALPVGYRFYKDSNEEKIWIDETVINS